MAKLAHFVDLGSGLWPKSDRRSEGIWVGKCLKIENWKWFWLECMWVDKHNDDGVDFKSDEDLVDDNGDDFDRLAAE